MKKIAGISGSLRKGSFNTELLRAAAGFMPAGAEPAVWSIRGIPLYDGDAEEASGVPKPVGLMDDALNAQLRKFPAGFAGSLPETHA